MPGDRESSELGRPGGREDGRTRSREAGRMGGQESWELGSSGGWEAGRAGRMSELGRTRGREDGRMAWPPFLPVLSERDVVGRIRINNNHPVRHLPAAPFSSSPSASTSTTTVPRQSSGPFPPSSAPRRHRTDDLDAGVGRGGRLRRMRVGGTAPRIGAVVATTATTTTATTDDDSRR
jgi:hypothetical protein